MCHHSFLTTFPCLLDVHTLHFLFKAPGLTDKRFKLVCLDLDWQATPPSNTPSPNTPLSAKTRRHTGNMPPTMHQLGSAMFPCSSNYAAVHLFTRQRVNVVHNEARINQANNRFHKCLWPSVFVFLCCVCRRHVVSCISANRSVTRGHWNKNKVVWRYTYLVFMTLHIINYI